ncbi:MAG: anti-sigma factor antagonist [Actinomycetota bacterium]|jgi:anti-anti-sigma factor
MLEVDATRRDDHSVLAVAGELDILGAPVLQEAVDRVLQQSYPSLVLDLSAVRFLDSAGLRVLVYAHRTLNEQGGRLRIVCTTRRVREVLRVSNLEHLFAVFGSVDEALAASAGADG